MMNRLIKKILKEELHVSNTNSPKEIYIDGFVFPATEKLNESESVNDKVSLAKSLIYQLFDEVNYIKISEYHGKPLIKVYFDSDDTAANIESFFTHEICDTLKDYTGGEIVCNPGWGPEWRTNRNNPDILIDAIQLEYDDEGNVINESKEYNTKVVERNLSVINSILSEISWEGLCEVWVEYNDTDKDYEIRSKSTKRHFNSDEIFKELGYLDNTIRSMGIRVYIYTPWYVENCEDEPEFLNEDYSPAGKEIIPNEIVVHKSNPIWRKNILETGLQVSVGECYKTYVGYGEKCVPAIFATNSTNKRAWFDSTYDDDIWFINTKMIPDVKWYKDKHFESTKKHIVTFENIPPEALTLKYQGSGSDKFLKESENKKSNYLNVIKQLVEPFKNEDCVCEIKVVYDKEDDMYNVYAVTSTEKLRDKFFYVNGIRQHLIKLVDGINKTIVSYLPIDNLYVGTYGKPNCEWNPNISESEEKKVNYLNTIIDIVEPFKNEDCLCEIEVGYDDEDDFYVVNMKFNSGDLVKKFPDPYRIDIYVKKLRNKIKEDLSNYLPIPNVYVSSEAIRDCNKKPLGTNLK